MSIPRVRSQPKQMYMPLRYFILARFEPQSGDCKGPRPLSPYGSTQKGGVYALHLYPTSRAGMRYTPGVLSSTPLEEQRERGDDAPRLSPTGLPPPVVRTSHPGQLSRNASEQALSGGRGAPQQSASGAGQGRAPTEEGRAQDAQRPPRCAGSPMMCLRNLRKQCGL